MKDKRSELLERYKKLERKTKKLISKEEALEKVYKVFSSRHKNRIQGYIRVATALLNCKFKLVEFKGKQEDGK